MHVCIHFFGGGRHCHGLGDGWIKGTNGASALGLASGSRVTGEHPSIGMM